MPASSAFTAEGLVETIVAEGPLGMAAVARLCGSYRSGKPTHPKTVTRSWGQRLSYPMAQDLGSRSPG